jgi:sulfate permease, SulP family
LAWPPRIAAVRAPRRARGAAHRRPLLLARLARLGFLANFLSRTVLVGFLTEVGIQVAAAQLPDMLGITASGTHTLSRLGHTLAALPRAHPATVAVSAAVIVVLLATRKITRRIPGPLIAVTSAIVVSRTADLPRRGVAVIGPVHRGLPPLGPPALGLHHAAGLLGPATWMFVVILGQSAGTAHAYADRHGETVSADTDLVGLGAANLAAAFSGTFVVNGSPTQTQMVDGAGGRSQLAQLTAGGVVLAVLLFLTGPLVSLPTAALAAVVFVIGVELVDAAELRRILSVRRDEFAIALLAAASVVVLSVQDGIILAALASIIGHCASPTIPATACW